MRQFLKHGLTLHEGKILLLPGPPESLVSRVLPTPMEMAEYLLIGHPSVQSLSARTQLLSQFQFCLFHQETRDISWLLAHPIQHLSLIHI